MLLRRSWTVPFVLLACASCAPNIEGDWEGTGMLNSSAGDFTLKDVPLKLHATKEEATITGAPFTDCKAKVTRKGKHTQLDYSGGRCKFKNAKGVELVMMDEWGTVEKEGKNLGLGLVPQAGKQGNDLAFTLDVHPR